MKETRNKFSEDQIFEQKIQELAKQGFIIETIRECVFRRQLSSISHIETPGLDFILRSTQSEAELLNAIECDAVFGYLICDIESTEETHNLFHNFPPIVERFTLTSEHIPEHMKKIIENTYKKSIDSFSRETLIQKYNAKGKRFNFSLKSLF